MGAAAVSLERLQEAAADVLGDFSAFCSLLNIRTKAGGIAPFHCDSWWSEQRRFEQERTGRDLVVKPRQVGFSTLELARDLHHALIVEGAQVLVVVHDAGLKEQLYLTTRMMAEALKAIGLLPKTRYSTKTELVFEKTGAAVRIVEAGETERAASKKGRSGTVHRLHATEVAFWGAAGETMTAILGSLTPDAEVVVESTPNGAGGLFYEDVQAARAGRSDYKLHFFPWYEHEGYRTTPKPGFDRFPRDQWEEKLRGAGCDDSQIAWWRSKVDDPKFGLEQALQEYPIDLDTCFRSPGRRFIEAGYLDAIAGLVREPKETAPLEFKNRRYGEALIYEKPARGMTYEIGADVSEGIESDAHSATVLERKSGRTVATWWTDSIEPGDFGIGLAVLGWLYNTARITPERNNHGHTTIRALQHEAGYTRIYQADDGKLGWITNSATRPPLWDELAFAIRERATFTPDAATLAECRTIVRGKDGKPVALNKGAKDGCKDDRYVSWAIAWQMRTKPIWEPKGFHIRGL